MQVLQIFKFHVFNAQHSVLLLYKAPANEEGSDRLRGERDQVKFIDLGFEQWIESKFERRQVAGFGKGKRRHRIVF